MQTIHDAIEQFDARDANAVARFGQSRRARREARRQDPTYQRDLLEVAHFYRDVLKGQRPISQLQEALTTGDFPLLFGDVIDREILGEYVATTKSWPMWAKRGTVPDFRLVNRFAVDGAEAALPAVPQGDQYSETLLTDTRYQYQVGKYGRRISFAWEAMVNDDLDGLKSIPGRLGRGAARAEEKFATQLIADVNGPHASFYTAGNKNQVITANGAATNNPALSVTGITDAFNVLSRQVDKDGEPIAIEGVVLGIPPSLRFTAENLMNATELWITGDAAGGTSAQQLHVANWLRSRLSIAVLWYLPTVASVANGSRSWFLFADPGQGRPAIEMGFLRGYEDPQTFVKLADSQVLGGGIINPTDGDFDTDTVTYKIRHVFGGTRMDPKVTVASNGSGV